MRFFMSTNVSVRGLKIKNSPQFHFRFDNCRNIIVDGIHVNSPASSPNTDGIHVENTQNVGIYNSIIANGTYIIYYILYIVCVPLQTSHSLILLNFKSLYYNKHFYFPLGDDCVSIGAGTSNVDIKNITCGPGHGIRST